MEYRCLHLVRTQKGQLVKEQERIEVRQRSGGKGPLHDEAVALNGALRPNGA